MTEAVATPGSCKRRRTVAVLGGGIAGLTAAQELAERGFDVTVYEPRADERCSLDDGSAGTIPPVKLGGLASSQYSTVGPYTGSLAQLRPFPGRRGHPRDPGRAVAGEHGFRFFPAYYIHIWDLFQRIPVYERTQQAHGEVRWFPTSRTIMDNVRRVVTQGTTVEGKPSLVFPREAPRTPAEFLTTAGQTHAIGLHRPGRAHLREQAASLSRHQSAASRIGTAERVRIRLLRRTRCAGGSPRFSYSPRSMRSCTKCPEYWPRSTHTGAMRAQPQHRSAAVLEYGPPRQQGRRGAQRSHHRVVVRPLVPPPRRTRCPLRPHCGDSPRSSGLRPDSATPSATPCAQSRSRTVLG